MTTESFEIQRCSKRCAATDRELQPGEPYYSVIQARGAEVIRLDYAADAWPGAPANSLGWWKARIPDAATRKVQLAPNDVILNYFADLETRPGKEDLRYVLSLLMIRRRIVRLDETQRDEAGQEILVMFCPRNETEYKTTVVMPHSAARAAEIQKELSLLLFADSP